MGERKGDKMREREKKKEKEREREMREASPVVSGTTDSGGEGQS